MCVCVHARAHASPAEPMNLLFLLYIMVFANIFQTGTINTYLLVKFPALLPVRQAQALRASSGLRFHLRIHVQGSKLAPRV